VVAGGNKAGKKKNQLKKPEGLAIAGDGSVLVADTMNHRVVRWGEADTEGVVVFGGKKGNKLTDLFKPTSVAVDGQDIYICDSSNNRILKVRESMADAQVVAGGSKGKKLNQLNKPFDVHFFQGSLYVADMMNHRVLVFKAGSTQGTLVAGTGKKGTSLDKLANPTGITVCPKTNAVYVADNKNYRVVKWAPGAQEGVLVAGGSKGSGLAQFKEPRDVAIGAAGVYVSDRTNGRVVLWTEGAQEGILLASVSSPTGLAAASDFLFIAEQNAHQVTAWSIQAKEDEGKEDEGKEDEGKEDEGKDEGDGEGLLPEVGNMKLKNLDSDLHRCAGPAAEMLDDEIDPGDCARLCDAKAACRFAVYDAKNAVCESYTTCSKTEKTDTVWIVYEKEGGEETGEMEQVIGDMHRVVFDSHFQRCGGRPRGGWDGLGRGMDPEDCGRKAAKRPARWSK
jgi:sugar lactone lactonase YvrE